MIWRAYLIYKTPRFKSCFNHSLIDSELQSWAGTQIFFLFFLSLLWIKLVPTKLYFSACKPYHNNNKIHISICKIRALRMNKFITTQESIGKNRFTDGLQIVAVNMFSISLWKNHFGTQGRTLCINFFCRLETPVTSLFCNCRLEEAWLHVNLLEIFIFLAVIISLYHLIASCITLYATTFLAMCLSSVPAISARIHGFVFKAACIVPEITFSYRCVLWESVSACRLTTKYPWKQSHRRSWCCREMLREGPQNPTLILAFNSEVKWICITSEQLCYVVLNVEFYMGQCRWDLLQTSSRSKRSWNEDRDWCSITKSIPGRLPS